MSVPSGIGLNIADFRHDRGMVLHDLSEASGVSVSYLSEIEREGGERVGVDVLRRIAKGLDVGVVDLLDETHTHAWRTCGACGGRGVLRVRLDGRGSS